MDWPTIKLIGGAVLILVAVGAQWQRFAPAASWVAAKFKRSDSAQTPVELDPQVAAVHCYRRLCDRMQAGGTAPETLLKIHDLVWPEIGKMEAKP